MRKFPNIIRGMMMAGLLAGLLWSPRATLQAQTGQGLEISPPLVELAADPGTSVTTVIKVRNVTKEPLMVKGSVNDFVASGEFGSPKVLLDEEEEVRLSVKNWVEEIGSFRLEPQQQREVAVTFNVPADAVPGGRYGVVRFSGFPVGLEDSGVALTASIGTLVLMTVSGDITESLKLEEFYSALDCKQKQNSTDVNCGQRTGFFTRGPVHFVERIKNDGTIHLKPTGSITVKNIFGRTTGEIEVNPQPHRNILPDSIRRFDQDLGKKFLFGRYTADLNLSYGNDKTLTARIAFWVIPWQLIIITLLLLVIAFMALRSMIRDYNRRVIEKARKNSER